MKKQMIGKCRICGSDYSCHFYDKRSKIRRYMLKEQVCDKCATWLMRKKDPNAREVIVDGIAYDVMPYQEHVGLGEFLGSNGKLFCFIDLDTLVSFKSNDVWKVGPVPEAMHIKDNAVMTSKSVCRALCDGPFVCNGEACLDRYTCVMYLKELEKEPVNTVPKGWVDGSERCQSYININKADKIIMEWRKKELLQRKE